MQRPRKRCNAVRGVGSRRGGHSWYSGSRALLSATAMAFGGASPPPPQDLAFRAAHSDGLSCAMRLRRPVVAALATLVVHSVAFRSASRAADAPATAPAAPAPAAAAPYTPPEHAPPPPVAAPAPAP